MKRVLPCLLLLTWSAIATIAWAGGVPDGKVYGPFQVLTHNKTIIRDLKYVAEEDAVYLQLFPDYKEKEMRVKLSNDYFSSYREWHHGGYELVSPANQGKTPYGWTDFVNTSANYIEYWMDGEVILHLKRVK